MLTRGQESALQLVIRGHNLVVCGQAGTGKSFLIEQIFKSERRRKNVSVLATTGIACTNFPESMQAKTIHSWSGILDGRYSVTDLHRLVITPAFETTRKLVVPCQLLIMDEISMLSSHIFEQVELVCRLLKGNTAYFGGIQVVAVGDFLQLPPVPNARYGDMGEMCFQHELWDVIFPHKVILDTVMTQNDITLVSAIGEIARGGVISEETASLMKSLDRPLTVQNEAIVKLFPTNYEASVVNYEIMEGLSGEFFTYKSVDNGNCKLFNESRVPSVLKLKEGCRVMVTVNLYSISQQLVNGSRGTVIRCQPNKFILNGLM